MQKDTRGIGKDNTLPWRVAGDLANFKKVTKNNIVVMGRKTFESLPSGALPDRLNVVISRDVNYDCGTGAFSFTTIEEALEFCEFYIDQRNTLMDVFIIGGAQIYAATDHLVDEKIITLVKSEAACDTFLPSTYCDNIDKYLSCQMLPYTEGKDSGVIYHVTCKKEK